MIARTLQEAPGLHAVAEELPLLVKIQYFKPSGEFYTTGTYLTSKKMMVAILHEVRGKLASGDRPGLPACDPGKNEFFSIVTVPEHPRDFPTLILPLAQPASVSGASG